MKCKKCGSLRVALFGVGIATVEQKTGVTIYKDGHATEIECLDCGYKQPVPSKPFWEVVFDDIPKALGHEPDPPANP